MKKSNFFLILWIRTEHYFKDYYFTVLSSLAFSYYSGYVFLLYNLRDSSAFYRANRSNQILNYCNMKSNFCKTGYLHYFT